MSLTQYLKYNIYIIILFSFLMSKYVEPVNISNTKEDLTIHKKDREYSRLIEDKLVYFIEGPMILNIYSRKAFPEKSKKDKSYQFEIVVDENKSILAEHNHRKDSKVYNIKHPGYAYTLAGKDVVNIPKGQHRIELISLDKKDKILIRSIITPFKEKNKISEVYPIDYKYINSAILKEKNQKFYMLSNNVDNSEKIEVDRMLFKAKGPNLIRIISRTTFKKDSNEYYQFKIRKNDQLVSTHHMIAKKSDNAKIINKPSFGISKWRTTLIDVPKGEHEYEIELISPDDKYVLFKIQEDKK